MQVGYSSHLLELFVLKRIMLCVGKIHRDDSFEKIHRYSKYRNFIGQILIITLYRLLLLRWIFANICAEEMTFAFIK